MITTDFKHEMICEFASKDKKRGHLNTIYFDDIGVAVSSDGHRLFATSSIYIPENSGKVYDIHTFFEKNEFLEVDEKYPEWKVLFDEIDLDNYKTLFELEIPNWFLTFKGNKEKTLFTIDFSDGPNPKIVSGNFQDDLSFGIDGRYLAPFHGKKIIMHVNDGVTPILITPRKEVFKKEKGSLDNLKILEWFSLIMPIKLDPPEKTDKFSQFVFV